MDMPKPSRLKGFDKLQAHVPGLRTPFRIALTLVPPALLFYLVLTFFVIEDMTWQFWLVDGEVVVGAIGFLILRLFFRLKPDLIAKYGSKAYSLAFTRIVLPALAIIFAIVARIGYIPGPPIPHLWWHPILPALGWTLIAIGAALWVRAVLTFGVDNLTMLYVYFPLESQITDHAIYGVIRHPIYGAAQRIGFGLALLNGNWFALTLSLIFALGLWVWVRLVEEKELIERFGESYSEYRKQTPAFWPRLQHIPAFFRFLLTGR
jgi:protein-S-isoprenylcysteine O-methyltransferase Ste14